MELTICTLRKEGYELILHGMIHTAPADFYKKIQREINQYNCAGRKIFYEGIRESEGLDETSSQTEKDIAEYFDFMSDIFPDLVIAWGLASQHEIKYPDGAVNADISYREMVQKLAGNGFAESKRMKSLIMNIKDEKKRSDMKKRLQELGRKMPIMKLMGILSKFDFLFNGIFKTENEIILHYRNTVAIDTIDKYKVSNNIIYYGEGHISSMLKLMQKSGWNIINSTKINPSKCS